jgi:hypothetical protein
MNESDVKAITCLKKKCEKRKKKILNRLKIKIFFF